MSDLLYKLKNNIEKLMREYDQIYNHVSANNDWKNPFRNIIGTDIPRELAQCAGIKEPYIVEGSYGKGRWTAVPWIAVFDKRITSSAQRGVYIVYLLNKDAKELYLAFEIAATEAMEIRKKADGSTPFTGVVGNNNRQLAEKLQKRAEEIRDAIPDSYFMRDRAINSGATGYDSGAVYYKKYTLDNLPSGEVLINDLKRMMRIYEAYYNWVNKAKTDDIDEADVKIISNQKEMTEYMNTKDIMNEIKTYIAAAGFHYEGDMIENFFLSLKSKPFVILAGISGTGKTKLVKLFAKAIGAKMKLVPVRPDWSDSSDLFGHTDLSGRFHEGAVLDFIKQAENDRAVPYFLCLDEMNLARVEYYFSDFLSIMETRAWKDSGAIETDLLIDETYYKSPEAQKKYGRVFIPDNLYIIGTVNMDETTFPFSKKVLDRANTIEFSTVNLMAKPMNLEAVDVNPLGNRFLKTEYLTLQDCGDEELIETVCNKLETINRILAQAQLHIGYRVRDEIVFYMMNNKKAELLTEDAAFDHEIMQKLLPRIQGSSSAIRDVLSELFTVCAGDYTGLSGSAAYEQMQAFLEAKTCKHPDSAMKIAFMMRRYEEDGFTSYWI